MTFFITVISYHFYLEPTQSFPVAIFTQRSHLITPSLSVVSLHLASNLFFPKSSEVPRSAAARGPAIYKQVLPLAGAKTSITTQLPTVPLQRAISFATKSQPGKHLRVLTHSKVKKPCATMVPGTKETTELGKIDGGWHYLAWGQNSSCMDVCMLWEQRHKVIFGYLPVYCYPAMAWPI